MSRNYSEQEEHKIKPHLLRNLSKHTAVVIHCEWGHRTKLCCAKPGCVESPVVSGAGKSAGSAISAHLDLPAIHAGFRYDVMVEG